MVFLTFGLAQRKWPFQSFSFVYYSVLKQGLLSSTTLFGETFRNHNCNEHMTDFWLSKEDIHTEFLRAEAHSCNKLERRDRFPRRNNSMSWQIDRRSNIGQQMLFGSGEIFQWCISSDWYLELKMEYERSHFQIMLHMAANFSYCLLSLFIIYRSYMAIWEITEQKEDERAKEMWKLINHMILFVIWFAYHLAWIILVVTMASVTKREVNYQIW